jgi:hypothetical protein
VNFISQGFLPTALCICQKAYAGAALLILGTVPLLLGFSLAGTQYDWLSPQIIGLFGMVLIMLNVLVLYASRLETHTSR